MRRQRIKATVGSRWSGSDYNKAVSLWQSGATDEEIAKAMGRSLHAVRAKLRHYRRRPPAVLDVPDVAKAQIADRLHSSPATIEELADLSDLSTALVERYLSHNRGAFFDFRNDDGRIVWASVFWLLFHDVRGIPAMCRLVGLPYNSESQSDIISAAMRVMRSYRPDKGSKPWSYLTNWIANGVRTLYGRHRKHITFRPLENADKVEHKPCEPSDCLQVDEIVHRVRDCLEDKEWQLLKMIYLDGWSYIEAGKFYGWSRSSVKNKLTRIKQKVIDAVGYDVWKTQCD